MTKDLKMSIVRDLMRVHYNGTDHKKRKNVVISITQYFKKITGIITDNVILGHIRF